ncbi:hypothetical protein J3E72DRAFT_368742 [Bipolaris maydis]|nr:hypothetical protein J3E72DRAFT_368742 [Bipolaris maydis]
MGITDFFTDVWETFSNPSADAEHPVQGEEEPDPKDKLEKECAESKECHGPKHHYDECAQRVTGQIEEKGKADEDCVEECLSLPHLALTHRDELMPYQFSTWLTAQPNAPPPSSSLSSSKPIYPTISTFPY